MMRQKMERWASLLLCLVLAVGLMVPAAVAAPRTVNFVVTEPEFGEKPSTTLECDTKGIDLNNYDVIWYRGSGYLVEEMGKNEKFQYGYCYTVLIYSSDFYNSDDNYTINGKAITQRRNSEVDTNIGLTYDFPSYDTIDLKIKAPVIGEKPSSTVTTTAVGLDQKIKDCWVTWYKDGTDWQKNRMDENETFAATHTYSARIFGPVLYYYLMGDTEFTINGMAASKDLIHYSDVDTCVGVTFYPLRLKNANFEITAPEVGKTPSYTVTSDTPGVSLSDYGVTWYKDGTDWNQRMADKTEKFAAGHTYTAKIYSDDLYNISENYTINGTPITDSRYGEVDTYISLTFPALKEAETSSDPVAADSQDPAIKTPSKVNYKLGDLVIGQKPPTTVTCDDPDYALKNYKVIWHKNGTEMAATDTVDSGCQYIVTIQSEEFSAISKDPGVYTINGLALTDSNLSESGNTYICTVTTLSEEVEPVKVNFKVTAPVAGKTPDFALTCDTTEFEDATVVWYEEDNRMGTTDVFKSNTTVTVRIVDDELYSFGEYTINGQTPTDFGSLHQNRMEYIAIDLPVTGTGSSQRSTFPFTDVKKSDWFYDSVLAAYQMELIEGMKENAFDYDGNMTYAQAITLAARMNQKYLTGEVTLTNGTKHWYDTYVEYCMDRGIIDQDYSDVINDKIDRQTYVYIFSKALPASEFSEKNSIPVGSIPDVGKNNPCYDSIYLFYRAGILNGSGSDGSFHPTDNIRRSEVAAILIRMMDPDFRVGAPAGLKT